MREDTQGEKDIYVAKLKDETSQLVVMKGFILNNVSKEPIAAKIKVTNKKTQELLGIYNSNKNTGKYVIIFNKGTQYDIEIEAPGYKTSNDFIDGHKLTSYEEIDKNIILVPDNSKNPKDKKKKNNSKQNK